MASKNSTVDKERGNITEKHATEISTSDESEEEWQPKTRQTLFLLIMLWLSYAIFNVFNLLLQLEFKLFQTSSQSPLEFYLYMKGWDLWIHKYDIYGILTPKNINNICIGAITSAFLFFWGLRQTLPQIDPIFMSITQGVLALSLPLASWAGLVGREIAQIIIPFITISAITLWIFMLRTGVQNVRLKLEVTQKTADWWEMASGCILLASCELVYGPFSDAVVGMALFKIVTWIYRKLG